MVADLPTETELLQFACTHCLAQLCVPTAMAGVTGPCPHCGNTITAPWPTRNRAPQPLETVFPTYTEHVPAPKREPAPLARDRAPVVDSAMPPVVENPSPLAEELDETPVRGIALFEKRSFRPIRTVLAVAACVTIFLSFEALKTRRWVWQTAKSDAIASEMAPVPQELPPTPAAPSTPSARPIPSVTPPTLPNLGSLSAENR